MKTLLSFFLAVAALCTDGLAQMGVIRPPHPLVVDNGTGDGSYSFGHIQEISAPETLNGSNFLMWITVQGGYSIANPRSRTTTLKMLGHPMHVAAIYANAKVWYPTADEPSDNQPEPSVGLFLPKKPESEVTERREMKLKAKIETGELAPGHENRIFGYLSFGLSWFPEQYGIWHSDDVEFYTSKAGGIKLNRGQHLSLTGTNIPFTFGSTFVSKTRPGSPTITAKRDDPKVRILSVWYEPKWFTSDMTPRTPVEQPREAPKMNLSTPLDSVFGNAGTGFGYSTFKYVSSVLLPVEVVPDYNRDGMINDEDRGKVTEEKPFVFWTNDDDDQNPEPHFGDIPGTNTDSADMIVNDARDLVDFFPVQLRIKEVLAAFPADKYTYKISHPTGAFHFIEMPDVHPDSSPLAQGAGAYLRNPTMADDAISRPMLDTAGQGAELTAEYLNAAKDGMGVLLFEAKSATNQSFELIISKKDGGGEVGRITRAMPVEIVDVEKMFWRANIRPAAYGQTPGAIIEPASAKFKASRKERWFVFCHGYNVSEEAARGWNSEVFKRLHQMGSDSKFLGVTWEGNQGQINPSIPFAGGATPDYWQNVYNAFQSSASLSTLVNGLSGGAKVIAGHSLGNMLVSSAICDNNLNVEKYFMLNAAVPREAYSTSHTSDRLLVRNPSWSQHDGDTRLWSSDYWNLFPNNDGRRKLTWNGRFSSLGANTAAHNYYSSGEEVLKKGNGSKPNLFLDVTIKSQFAWVKQEMSKGELTKKLVTGTHSSNGGWAYNSGLLMNFGGNSCGKCSGSARLSR